MQTSLPLATLLYFTITLASIMGIFLAAAVIYVIRIRNRLHSLELDTTKAATESEVVKEKLRMAEERGREIISQAEKEAHEIIMLTEHHKEEAQRRLEKELSRITDEAVGALASSIQGIEGQTDEVLQKITYEIKSQIEAQVGKVGTSMEKAVTEVVNEERLNVRNEMESYKLVMSKRIDELAYEIIKSATQQVLPGSISIDIHEDLVIASLEEAKKEHGFR